MTRPDLLNRDYDRDTSPRNVVTTLMRRIFVFITTVRRVFLTVVDEAHQGRSQKSQSREGRERCTVLRSVVHEETGAPGSRWCRETETCSTRAPDPRGCFAISVLLSTVARGLNYGIRLLLDKV